GLDICNGDAVVLIDADLQDPPELISDMVEMWKSGFDVVYGQRTIRKGESVGKKLSSKLFYRFLSLLSDIPIPIGAGDFRLMDKKVVDVLRIMPESPKFFRGLVSWIGFEQVALPFVRESRAAGETKYGLKKMISLALTGITAFSTRPLKIATFGGIACAGLSACLFVYVIYSKLFGDPVVGWTAIMASIFLIGGMQLLCLGIIGEYVGSIFLQQKGRPTYVVKEQTEID
ncbi:MAG: glycosyltransferase, partial [Candidatus Azotimanducaceae bacterium]